MIPIEAKSRLTSQYNTSPAALEHSKGEMQNFEYLKRGERVQIWENAFNSTFGIKIPRWDATDVFHPERFGSYSFNNALEVDPNDKSKLKPVDVVVFMPSVVESDHVLPNTTTAGKFETATGNGAENPEFFTDITDYITQTVKKGLELELNENGGEIEEAVISFAVNSTLRLQKEVADPALNQRMRQFVINTIQRLQIEAYKKRSSVNKYEISRKFDEELDIAQNAATPRLTSDNEKFMLLNDEDKWEQVTMYRVERLLPESGQKHFERVRRAVVLAQKLHKDQSHLGLSPYIVHLYRVMNRIMEDPSVTRDPQTLTKALCIAALHDTIEDTNITPDELNDHFGAEITQGVLALSKWINTDGMPEDFNPDEYYENLYRQPPYVRFVKGYDRVDNWASSHKKVNQEIEDKRDAIRQQEKYFEETSRYYKPLVSDNPKLEAELEHAMYPKNQITPVYIV